MLLYFSQHNLEVVKVFVFLWVKVIYSLTGTLGSDTAMLSGYTVAFTHWFSVAAKRYGSFARSQRSLWEHLEEKDSA